MLGFAFANPAAVSIIMRYAIYVSEVIKNDSPAELEAVGKFLKRSAGDKRRRVLWVDKIETLRRVQQEYPAEKIGDMLIGVFDVGEKLAQNPDIKIVDAELEAKTDEQKAHATWAMHRYNLESAMQGAAGGYTLLKPRKGPPQDSLQVIFGSLLGVIQDEKKRQKAAGFVAARLEGILSKEDWAAALTRIAKYGVEADILKAGLRAYKDAGLLKPLRTAVRAIVVDGVEPEIAAQVAETRLLDLQWLDQNWAFSNLSIELFVA